MAKKTISFKVEKKDGVQAFWIAVNQHDVPINGEQGSISVDEAGDHMLVWAFEGDSGGKLAITGTVGAKTVVEVKQSVIPPNRHRASGFKSFDLN